MSIIPKVYIVCDSGLSPECHEHSSVNKASPDAARSTLRAEGWTATKIKRHLLDACPQCSRLSVGVRFRD